MDEIDNKIRHAFRRMKWRERFDRLVEVLIGSIVFASILWTAYSILTRVS